jgi:hypothetical protein
VVLRGLVDVTSVGQRIRAERYAVVREPDGALTYCGRTIYKSPEGQGPQEMTVLQRTREGKLDEFEVALKTGEDEAFSHGLWVGGSLRIDRRLNGVQVDTKRVRERIACIDIGSVTTSLLLTQLVRTESFQIVTFHELLEPELALWIMDYGGEGRLTHSVRTHKGVILFQSTKLGSVEFQRNAISGGSVETILVEEDGLGGAGLPPPPEKLALVKQGPEKPTGDPGAEQGKEDHR